MELVGDYSENPFENLINDVPINAMSRNIEIELREYLGEKDLPPKVLPIDDILL
jgi:putative membrane protein